MKRKIEAKIVADSVSPQGHRITTFILTYPRFIHAEIMTHRMFSRNAASSRAIPFDKMVKSIQDDPFIPIAWQKDHKGMQGTEYIEDQKIIDFKTGVWLQAHKEAIHRAKELNGNISVIKKGTLKEIEGTILENTGVTKQICNRLLEPFMWYTNLVTATEFDNFFELRCPKYEMNEGIFRSWKDYCDTVRDIYPNSDNGYPDYNESILEKLQMSTSGAEIHIQILAEAMWDARNESKPAKLKGGKWHIPFMDKFDDDKLFEALYGKELPTLSQICNFEREYLKIATARAARLSYMTFDGEINYKKDIELHDMLLKNKHASPFEHCAKVMTNHEYETHYKGELTKGVDYFHPDEENQGWCRNFKGFIPYRHLIEKE